ncbi:NAD(P)/FAD-dependent oxidoreductase [Paenibacillus hodogayensis]|uniref:NAD(P)/FAD-dependent oxidoreductase n=1 Tax=Paenibacillus hodogayensis TaxID=279208 RepID=A0ABV5W8Z4_9BACL
MDLHSGKSYWLDRLPPLPSYPALDKDITCDVLVIGTGSGGAVCAFELVRRGLDVVVVDKREVGSGSSSANTGLLQTSNDKPLFACINSLGTEKGVRFYRLCREALTRIEVISKMLDVDPEFKRRDSLYYASSEADVADLRKEYEALSAHGFDVEYWEERVIGERFSFRKPAAIYTRNDAEINPYRYVNALLLYASRHGARIYEHTEIKRHTETADGIEFYTPANRIRARYAIVAAGYEAQEWRRNPNAAIASTFAVATQRLDGFPGWHERSLIWETARPYLYMRTTADNRIIVGGLDEPMNDAEERERMLPHKAELLIEQLQSLFPQIPGLRAEYHWTAAFGDTHDGLPLIGTQESFPRCFFTLGYGGNGTAYCTFASQIIAGLITDGYHPDADLFRFNRPKWPTATPV